MKVDALIVVVDLRSGCGLVLVGMGLSSSEVGMCPLRCFDVSPWIEEVGF